MDQAMKSLLINIFIKNWPRKLIALFIATIICLLVSLPKKDFKKLENISVKIINIPENKMVTGVVDDFLEKKISFVLYGNESFLNELNSSNVMILLDATKIINRSSKEILAKDFTNHKSIEDIKNVIIKSKDIVYTKKHIKKHVYLHSCEILQLNFIDTVKDTIPVLVTKPIGEPPKGYKYVDIWPYYLNITVKAPEKVLQKLKTQGLKYTVNLNNISKKDLDTLSSKNNEVSFCIPNCWKKINVPEIAYSNLQIDDPKANPLRIDFTKGELIALNEKVPISLFFPIKSSFKPKNISLSENNFIKKRDDIFTTIPKLYTKSASDFVDIVKDMLSLVVIVDREKNLLWNIEFIYASKLEDKYVAKVLSENNECYGCNDKKLQEAYVRNRFRNYMNNFRLFDKNGKKIHLDIFIKENKIHIRPQ